MQGPQIEKKTVTMFFFFYQIPPIEIVEQTTSEVELYPAALGHTCIGFRDPFPLHLLSFYLIGSY